MNNIENTVINFINENRLLAQTNKVYVATSGGADSMALLAFMHSHANEFNIEVGAVHVNHGIRGETARRDANFVKEYCEKNNIEFVLFDAESDNTEVPENASEEWARKLRYGYFSNLIMQGVKIATAHTTSDQLETVIFRMARGGSGINGMSGIPIQRDGYIRPFLCIGRSEVEQLVEYYGTGNITDETNLGDVYSRNKIRHTVVPVLKEINPNAEKSVEKLCQRFEKAYRYISKQATVQINSGEVINGIKYNTEVFIGIDDIILEEMFVQLLAKNNVQSEQLVEVLKNFVNKVHLDEATEVTVGELEINKSKSIMVTNWYITVKDNVLNQDQNCKEGKNTFGSYGYNFDFEEVTVEQFKAEAENKRNLCKFTALNKLKLDKCIVRSRKPGDTFKPACRIGGKLVKFMRNIPLAERESVPIIEYNGEIIWVWGIGFTDGFTPTESDIQNGEKVYKISWNQNY